MEDQSNAPVAVILGTGRAVPDGILTNQDLEQMVDTSDEWIRTRTGIRQRYIADAQTATSDLATIAAQRALDDAGVTPEELDLILVATISPDLPFPATACLVQHNIGAVNAAAFDLSAGCSGFVYALDMAFQGIRAGNYRRILVIGADCLSKLTNFQDRSTCILFGDGAGACVVGAQGEGMGIIASSLGADGSGVDKLWIRAGGTRHPASPETVAAGWHFIEMAGHDVFKFAVRIMVESSREVLAKANMEPQDIAFFIPHQANIRIIEAAAHRLKLKPHQVYVNVERYGNTSAASIGIALDELARSGQLKRGQKLLLVGFGAGLTWGSLILQWSKGEA
ncbi:MAG: beta-ketoacyl-ACP synthase III [Limnochordia bacterium]|jgi:3-oxoacyl-[acyl-carrier-protein] synthase-3